MLATWALLWKTLKMIQINNSERSLVLLIIMITWELFEQMCYFYNKFREIVATNFSCSHSLVKHCLICPMSMDVDTAQLTEYAYTNVAMKEKTNTLIKKWTNISFPCSLIECNKLNIESQCLITPVIPIK